LYSFAEMRWIFFFFYFMSNMWIILAACVSLAKCILLFGSKWTVRALGGCRKLGRYSCGGLGPLCMGLILVGILIGISDF